MLAVYLLMLSATADEPSLQAKHKVDFELGSGLGFTFDNGKHLVRVGGFIQPAWGIDVSDGEDPDQFLNARRTHFFLQGQFFDDSVEFFFQSDFSRAEPLLDAWLSYRPWSWLDVSVGQRQALTNNREMLHMESQLAFSRRSVLSRTFSLSGRELGLFVRTEVDLGGVIVRPQGSVTSGDGRNSFGADSRDVDIGGFKWGGRLDILPFGDFSEGNGAMVVDLAREQSLKVILGGAFSYNDGASHRNGAGHGDFFLYNEGGEDQLPDYVMIYADLLAKFRGFSLLAEFVNASATSLQGTYTDDSGVNLLFRTQISEFLILGNGFNAQLGYYLGAGVGMDVRYSRLFAEFTGNEQSLLKDTTAYGAGLTVYILKQTLKVQISYERLEVDNGPTVNGADLLVQLIL